MLPRFLVYRRPVTGSSAGLEYPGPSGHPAVSRHHPVLTRAGAQIVTCPTADTESKDCLTFSPRSIMSTPSSSSHIIPKKGKTMKRYTVNDVLTNLNKANNRSATRKQLNMPAVATLKRAQDDGLIRVVSKVETGDRGRPAHVFKLTSKGTNRAKKLAA